ncbi:insecticidal delta-endotoxin Cry8Ea1 family protein, partial [Viridibacillus sp. NPDC096237]|uniref:insecticidal delta-endotoxin Cry8Ea1 family protein n=1 Tax=Viridibacillus sp. NPDC096237 TaxID=3390721 RepID=UPI003D017DE4
MKKKHRKIVSMTVAASVLTGTYIPTATTVFAETEQKEGFKENQTKNSDPNNPLWDSRAWFDNPYKGVTLDQFINAFNNNQWRPLLADIQQKKDAGSGTLAFLKGMMTTGLSLLPPPASLLASIWDVFMPATSSNQTDIWKQLEEYIETHIDSKITDYHSYLMGANFGRATSFLEDYQRILQIYNDSRNSLARVEEPGAPVLEAARAADREFKGFIKVIQTPEKSTDSVYQQITAPIFVQAANAHLLLLRDIILYAEEWGIDKDQLEGYRDEQKKLIREYTDYAMRVYNDGLEKRKKEAEQINTQEKFRNTDRWNHINEYVREYTLSVLDFVALFPSTNPSEYSRGAMHQNSRQIYSDIGGKVQPKEKTWQDINNILASQEYKGGLMQLDIRDFDRIDAIRPWYSDRVNGGAMYSSTGWVGNTNGGILRDKISTFDNPLTKVTVGSEITPFHLTFTHDNGKTYPRFGTSISGAGREKISTFEFPNQKISLVHAFNRSTQSGFDGIDAVVFGFTDKRLKLGTELMTNMITSIPAEMYDRGMSNFKPQVEPIHAQQKAMKTDTTNSYLGYSVTTFKEQEYKIRYRVAANENSTIKLSHRSSPGNNFEKIGETTIPTTGYEANTVKGEYGYYKTIEGPTVKLKYGTNELKIENTKGKFSLDHIELEPVEKDAVIAQDNFDNQRLTWVNLGGIVDGGVTGKAGRIESNGDTWTYIENQVASNSKYTLSMKVKLESTDKNKLQNVTIFTDNAAGERIKKTVELKGGAGYRELKLDFITKRNLGRTHVGILTSGGTS